MNMDDLIRAHKIQFHRNVMDFLEDELERYAHNTEPFWMEYTESLRKSLACHAAIIDFLEGK